MDNTEMTLDDETTVPMVTVKYVNPKTNYSKDFVLPRNVLMNSGSFFRTSLTGNDETEITIYAPKDFPGNFEDSVVDYIFDWIERVGDREPVRGLKPLNNSDFMGNFMLPWFMRMDTTIVHDPVQAVIGARLDRVEHHVRIVTEFEIYKKSSLVVDPILIDRFVNNRDRVFPHLLDMLVKVNYNETTDETDVDSYKNWYSSRDESVRDLLKNLRMNELSRHELRHLVFMNSDSMIEEAVVVINYENIVHSVYSDAEDRRTADKPDLIGPYKIPRIVTFNGIKFFKFDNEEDNRKYLVDTLVNGNMNVETATNLVKSINGNVTGYVDEKSLEDFVKFAKDAAENVEMYSNSPKRDGVIYAAEQRVARDHVDARFKSRTKGPYTDAENAYRRELLYTTAKQLRHLLNQDLEDPRSYPVVPYEKMNEPNYSKLSSELAKKAKADFEKEMDKNYCKNNLFAPYRLMSLIYYSNYLDIYEFTHNVGMAICIVHRIGLSFYQKTLQVELESTEKTKCDRPELPKVIPENADLDDYFSEKRDYRGEYCSILRANYERLNPEFVKVVTRMDKAGLIKQDCDEDDDEDDEDDE